jgi:superfamily II DNA or RNA helicase
LIENSYIPINDILKLQLTKTLNIFGFYESKNLLRGLLFENSKNNDAIIIDYEIYNKQFPFSYTEYTKEQNNLMFKYRSTYRFVIDSLDDIESLNKKLSYYLKKDFTEDKIKSSGANRELSEIDPTIPEAYFEQAFIETFGRESLDKVEREFPIIDTNGQTRWVDYVVRHKDFNIAIEKNGETYHHPIIIQKKGYQKQLIKQNSLVAYGYKVFRWSLEGMKFKETFREEMKKFFGNKEDFLLSQKLAVSRKITLIHHQTTAIEEINTLRLNGEKNFLVVLPTGTGKTEIMISDILNSYHKNINSKTLILVPSRQLKIDTIKKVILRFNEEFSNHNISIGEDRELQIVVQTYSWMSRYYQQFKTNGFNYIAVDEAHHAVAPTLQKVIQHFNPETLLGLTATDKRLDEKKLEDIFGKYKTNLSLVDAIKQNILAPIKAFRVQSNIDLSEIRFNGKDYVSTDLQKSVIVPSRDQLIVDVLNKYFVGADIDFKSGLIFCVSIKHAKDLAKRMQENNISCKAVSGQDSKSVEYIEQYQKGQIQFLTTCSLLNEGWDSPRTSIIVMARPTMSKVLYTQQIGRGTRKYKNKEALYVIDVVDSYGGMGSFKNSPWSIHALLGISNYMQWGNILSPDEKKFSHEEIILAGLYEEERKLEKIDIFTFEEEYADYLSDEQLAREFFVSTGTIKSWVQKNKITPSVIIPIGRQNLNYYEPKQIEIIRTKLKLKIHNESTQNDDFYEFINEGTYSMSYKIIMMLSILKIIDNNGECNLDDLVHEYRYFYQYRLDNNLRVDRENCPYSDSEFLKNNSKLKISILQNPFEKFERKCFMYHSKDLNHIAFSNNLWQQVSKDVDKIKSIFLNDLIDYYQELDGVTNINELKSYWNIK